MTDDFVRVFRDGSDLNKFRRKEQRLINGVGVNDADYFVYRSVGGRMTRCHIYKTWTSMMTRCYSEALHRLQPTYTECYTVPEWYSFMMFKSWMETQDWEGKHLDKDLILEGNKVYGPDTCFFVSPEVNAFLLESSAARGEYPIGVSYHKASGKYSAQCKKNEQGQRHLGLFDSPELAYQAYKQAKTLAAIRLASEQEDKRIATAILNRFVSQISDEGLYDISVNREGLSRVTEKVLVDRISYK